MNRVFLPLAILFLAFTATPVVALTWRAVSSGELESNVTSQLVVDALWLSVLTSTVALTLTIVFGTPLAYLLARSNFPGKALVDLMVDLPIILPPTAAGVALLLAFGRRGILGGELDSLGIDLAFTTTAVVMAQVFVASPFYIRAARTGFESVDSELEGVAATLGAGPFRVFRQVLLPLSWPSVLAGAILCWARALSELGATLVFAGSFPGQTQTMPLAIIGVFGSGQSLNVAIALAVILMLGGLALLILMRLFASAAARQAL